MKKLTAGVLGLCVMGADGGVSTMPPMPPKPIVAQSVQPRVPSVAPPSAPMLTLEQRAWVTVDAPYKELVWKAAAAWGLDPWVLLALLWVESRFDPKAVNSRSGASGLGQFTGTGIRGMNNIWRARGHDREFTRAMTFDPKEAVPAAAELLAYWSTRFGTYGGVMAYNGGPDRKWFANEVLRWANRYRTTAGLPPVRKFTMRQVPRFES